MSVVVGTAGHIDHGKTTLLRALTGIDADRLPEERRRGMTIDVGYAHMTLDDGTEIDFVDVPGHDKLVGNMLVGAGEIDTALLVVAADDGPRAQTFEHVALLDALEIRHGLAVVTKADVVEPERVAEVVEATRLLLEGTSLAGSPVIAVSAVDGGGIDVLREGLVGLRDRVVAARGPGVNRGSRLAIDRVFAVRGRGTVVTGSLRGRRLEGGATLRLVPDDRSVRVREIQVHSTAVGRAEAGRTALNLSGVEAEAVRRGQVLTDDPAVIASERLLVRLAALLPDRTRARLHLGTAAVDAVVGRSGRDALELADGTPVAILRLAGPIAVAAGDRFVLRRTGGNARIVGGLVVDARPARGISRRRQTADRVGRLTAAVEAGDTVAAATARTDLHGVTDGSIAPDLLAAAEAAVLDVAGTDGGAALPDARTAAARTLRRGSSVTRTGVEPLAASVVDGLVSDGRLARDGTVVRLPGTALPTAEPDPALAAAMDRLEGMLAVPAPPSLSAASAAAACPPAGVRALEQAGRIVVLEPDLAYAAAVYSDMTATALAMARTEPLTPAALRDATGTSRKYVMAILADLDRRADPAPDAGRARPRATRLVTAPRVTAVILAGGRSSRFGRDKLAEPIDGRPLLDHAIEAVRSIAAEIIVVAAPTGMPDVPADVRVVHDPVAFEGPLAGTNAGIQAASESIVIVVAGDMPDLVVEVMVSMVDALDRFDAVVLEHEGRQRPLPMVVRRDPAVAAARRLLADGERRLRALSENLDASVIAEATWRQLDPDARTLHDIDTEADLI